MAGSEGETPEDDDAVAEVRMCILHLYSSVA